ncbi:MAG: M14 family zinc carboxypeptidase [Lysobacterales bacterium]|jgi:hypothetical protein
MSAARNLVLPGLAMAGLLAASAVWAQQARIVEWVENAPASDMSKIALGYPVPTPVDTPLPFDGFRSYAGLHMRHMDLAETTPWVHPSEIGISRGGRTIWLYRLGDEDRLTFDGLPEHAMLANGGIHAREWQTPEVATGIIELIATAPTDHHLVDYLRDNANVMVIPVMNVDGFLQTQRYPDTNWLGTDPDDPDGSPRDGRMRRKNMLGADENLQTMGDHLQGVDLNRNNSPYWSTNLQRSSSNSQSLVYHGTGPQSEPETRILDVAAGLGPAGRLSMYTDIHSFSQVSLWVRTGNIRQSRLTEKLLRTFGDFHREFPAGRFYDHPSLYSAPLNSGIGTTDEYFTHVYKVPSWTLETEPGNNAGAEYGGLGRNGHDGFILPESEIQRVRTQLAETFAVAYYQQSGPPAVRRVQVLDQATGAVVFQADWDTDTDISRLQHYFQAQPLQLDRPYRARVEWDKPMRWRHNGAVAALPGKSASTLDTVRTFDANGEPLDAELGELLWLDAPGGSPGGFRHYRDDTFEFDLRFPASETNLALVQGSADVRLGTAAYDMTGNRSDANPATVARWQNGSWAGYEDSNGLDQNDTGGTDSTVRFALTSQAQGEPFVVQPGTSSAWYDTNRNGEGFLVEVLDDKRAVMYWFTYDTDGAQDWYVAVGDVRGNRMVFPELIRVSGGVFGPDFDLDTVKRTTVGSAEFIWSSCDSGEMDWVLDRDGTGWRTGRMQLSRLTRVAGIECSDEPPPPGPVPQRRLSGSWYDPSHSGEGYVLETLSNGDSLVYWFTFDTAGNRRWFFGMGHDDGGTLVFDELFGTAGGVFGPGFDPEAVELSDWGSLELELDCDGGVARFEPLDEAFPAGMLQLARLTTLAGPECEN